MESSKTHDEGQPPQLVTICESNKKAAPNRFCPFKSLWTFLDIRPIGYKSYSKPFFVFRDRSPVKPCHFRKTLKTALDKIGLDFTLYNCHSFRVGHSVDLLKLGISVETIKKLGRWSANSNAVYKYLKYF